MSVFDKLGLGDLKAKKGWPYPPVSAHAPLALSQIVDLTWTIGEPRELSRPGLAWTYDRFNLPEITESGERPLLVTGFPIQTPIASLSLADVNHILATSQDFGFIPNDANAMGG